MFLYGTSHEPFLRKNKEPLKSLPAFCGLAEETPLRKSAATP